MTEILIAFRGRTRRETVPSLQHTLIRLLPHGPTRFVRNGECEGLPLFTIPAPRPPEETLLDVVWHGAIPDADNILVPDREGNPRGKGRLMELIDGFRNSIYDSGRHKDDKEIDVGHGANLNYLTAPSAAPIFLELGYERAA